MSNEDICNPSTCTNFGWNECRWKCKATLKCTACGKQYHPSFDEAKIRKESTNVESPKCFACYDRYWICDVCNQKWSPIRRVIRIKDGWEVSLCPSCDEKNDLLSETERKYKHHPIPPIVCKTCGHDITSNTIDLPIMDDFGPPNLMSFHYCLLCRGLWYDFGHCWFAMDDEDYPKILNQEERKKKKAK